MAKNDDKLKEYREKYREHLDIIAEMSKRYQDKEIRTKFYSLQSEITLLKAKKTEQQSLSADEEKQLESLTKQLSQASTSMLNINKQYHAALLDIVKSGAGETLIADTFAVEGRKNLRMIENRLNKDPKLTGNATDRQQSIKTNSDRAIRDIDKKEYSEITDNDINTLGSNRAASLSRYGSNKNKANSINKDTVASYTYMKSYADFIEADINSIEGRDGEKQRISDLQTKLSDLNVKLAALTNERTKNKDLAIASGKPVFMPELNEAYFETKNQIATTLGEIGQSKKSLLGNVLPAKEIKAAAADIVSDIKNVKVAVDNLQPAKVEDILPAKEITENAEKVVNAIDKVDEKQKSRIKLITDNGSLQANIDAQFREPSKKSAYESYEILSKSALGKEEIEENRKLERKAEQSARDEKNESIKAERKAEKLAHDEKLENQQKERKAEQLARDEKNEKIQADRKAEKLANEDIVKARKLMTQEIKTFEDAGNYSPEWLEKKKQLLRFELDQTKATEAQKQKIILESEKTLAMKLNGSKDKAKYYDTVKFMDKDYMTYRKNLIIEDVNNTKMSENQKFLYVKAKMAELKREQKNFFSFTGGIMGLGGLLPGIGAPLSIAAGVGSVVYGAKQIAKRGIDTENELKLLQAVGGYNSQDLEKLRDAAMSAALAVGAIPAEVLKLEQALSRNGKSVKEITESVAGIQNFAKVYQADFEKAADTASKVSNIFGVTMPRALDVMAVTMRETTINGLEEFDEALSKGSAMANALGYSVEESMALVGVAINKGMNPQDASNGLQKLLSQAKDINSQFAKATGGVANNFEELTAGIQKLTAAQKENLLVKWQGKNLTEEQSKILATVILNSIDDVKALKEKIVDSNGTVDRAIGDAMSSTSNMFSQVKSKVLNEFMEMYEAIEPGIKGILFITNKLLDTFFKVTNEEKQLDQSFRERIALESNMQIVKDYTIAIQNKDKAVLESVHRKNEYLTALGRLKQEYPDLLKNLDAEKSSYADIAKNMEAVAAAFENKVRTELAQSKLKDVIEKEVQDNIDYETKRKHLLSLESASKLQLEGKGVKESTLGKIKTRDEYAHDLVQAQEALKQLEIQNRINKMYSQASKRDLKKTYGITDLDLAGGSGAGVDPAGGGTGGDDETKSNNRYENNLLIYKNLAELAKFEADNDQLNFEKKRAFIEANYTYQKELLKKPLFDIDDKNKDLKPVLEKEKEIKTEMLNETKAKQLKQNALDEYKANQERLTGYLNYLNAAKAGDDNQHFRNIELENTQHLLKLNNLQIELTTKGNSWQEDYTNQKNLEIALHNQRLNSIDKENKLSLIGKQETMLQSLNIGKFKDYDALKQEIHLKGLRERTGIDVDDPDRVNKLNNSRLKEDYEIKSVDDVKGIDQKALEIKKLEIKREYGKKNLELELEILKAEHALRKSQIEKDTLQTEAQLNMALLANDKELSDKTTSLQKEKYEGWKDSAKQAYDAIKEISNSLYQMEIDNINRVADKKMKVLDKEHKAKVKEHQGATKTLNKIDEEYEKKKEALEEEKEKKLQKAKQQQQKWAIAEALINWGLGVTNIWSKEGVNPIVAGILTALLSGVMVANIAQISSQKFAKGVIKLQGAGGGESDDIHARLSAGESVLTARETNDNFDSLVELRRTGKLPSGNLHATQLASQNNKMISLLTQIVGHSKRSADETATNNQILDSKDFKPKLELPLKPVSSETIYMMAKEGEKTMYRERSSS